MRKTTLRIPDRPRNCWWPIWGVPWTYNWSFRWSWFQSHLFWRQSATWRGWRSCWIGWKLSVNIHKFLLSKRHSLSFGFNSSFDDEENVKMVAIKPEDMRESEYVKFCKANVFGWDHEYLVKFQILTNQRRNFWGNSALHWQGEIIITSLL